MLHNLGSINIDHFYRVPHLVRPGETLAGGDYRVGLGGKGANQSIALARAGSRVCHWGRLGRQDNWAREHLQAAGVDTRYIEMVDVASGHAIIQVDDEGENAILLFPGANHGFTPANLGELFENTAAGDWLLIQNECSGLAPALEMAHAKGLKVAFNPAPMTAEVASLPLHYCELLFVNRGEAEALTGLPAGSPAGELLDALARQLPETQTVLTLGGDGAWYQSTEQRIFQSPLPVRPQDTTAAGDTFIGYYLAASQAGENAANCLLRAATAAAIGVQRPGATESIPELAEVESELARTL
ncbi:ribokinase [Halomonas almeriensis]|uniref:ribokinase n=1 Tax=Halomonas almeriensis TaxID=308163 RepID=UPI0025B3FE82|nr:ribokinase [Halomonas almeriensis]MDN3554080.1 ribokinase [Halomonas almeriensis]